VTAPAFDPSAVPVRDAATVMLVRDAAGGIEVFMLRRNLDAAFGRGLYVFPGGKVDDADRSAEVERICRHRDDAGASAILGVPSGGLAYWVAAVRECFEEAGVLLAADAADTHSKVISFDDADVAAQFETARVAVHDGSLRFIDLCAAEGLTITADAIEYVSHWITPVGERRRFDTRFFVAHAPEGQEPLHDDGETIDSLWVHPGDALARQRRGELAMMPPTIANLSFLAEHHSADAVMAAAAALPRPDPVQPKLRRDADGRVEVVLPDDPSFADLPEWSG